MASKEYVTYRDAVNLLEVEFARGRREWLEMLRERYPWAFTAVLPGRDMRGDDVMFSRQLVPASELAGLALQQAQVAGRALYQDWKAYTEAQNHASDLGQAVREKLQKLQAIVGESRRAFERESSKAEKDALGRLAVLFAARDNAENMTRGWLAIKESVPSVEELCNRAEIGAMTLLTRYLDGGSLRRLDECGYVNAPK